MGQKWVLEEQATCGLEVGKEVYNQGSKEKKWGQDPQDELQQPGQLDGLLRANAAGVED